MTRYHIVDRHPYPRTLTLYVEPDFAASTGVLTVPMDQNSIEQFVTKDLDRTPLIRTGQETEAEFKQRWDAAAKKIYSPPSRTNNFYLQGLFTSQDISLLSITVLCQKLETQDHLLPKELQEKPQLPRVNIGFSFLGPGDTLCGFAISCIDHPVLAQEYFMVSITENAAAPNPDDRIATAILPTEMYQALYKRSLPSKIKSTDTKKQLIKQFIQYPIIVTLLEHIFLPSGALNLEFCKGLRFFYEEPSLLQPINELILLAEYVGIFSRILTYPHRNITGFEGVPETLLLKIVNLDAEFKQIKTSALAMMKAPTFNIFDIHQLFVNLLTSIKTIATAFNSDSAALDLPLNPALIDFLDFSDIEKKLALQKQIWEKRLTETEAATTLPPLGTLSVLSTFKQAQAAAAHAAEAEEGLKDWRAFRALRI